MKAKIIAFKRLLIGILEFEIVRGLYRIRLGHNYKDYNNMDEELYVFCKEETI